MLKFSPRKFTLELYRAMWKLLFAVITFDDSRQRSFLGKLWEVVSGLLLIVFFHVVLVVAVGGIIWGLSYLLSWIAPVLLGILAVAFLVWDWLSDRRTASAIADHQSMALAWEEVGTFVVVPVCKSLYGGSWDISMLWCPQSGALTYDISAANLSEQNDRIILERKIMRKLAEVYQRNYEELFKNKAAVVHGSRLFIK